MLSSSDQRKAPAGQDLKFAAHLMKPVKQSELMEAIVSSLSLTEGVPAPSVRAVQPKNLNSDRKLAVLVAEDNIVNQKLIVRLLQKQGHTVSLVENGADAIEIVEKQKFDIVMMDVQMPVMSGFEATAAIREREKTTGEHIVIVAFTAHAMKGDRDRCLDGGMDGYLTKPVRSNELFDVIESLAPRTVAG